MPSTHKLIRSPLIELTCHVKDTDISLVLEWLTEALGLNAAAEEKPNQQPLIKIFLKTREEAIALQQRLLKSTNFSFSDFRHKTLPYQRWATSWKKGIKVIRVTDRLVLSPSWLRYKKRSHEKIIRINPGMAFGTGQHETTHLSLEWIAAHALQWKTVCDVGCGSGILAISAIKLGVRRAFALDIDSEAIGIAKNNARLNHVSQSLEFFAGGLDQIKEHKPYDAVFANLTAHTIESNWKSFRKLVKPNGVLILSGIYDDEIPGFESFLKSQKSWKILDHKQLNAWHGYLLGL